MVALTYLFSRSKPVYLVNFHCYRPPDRCGARGGLRPAPGLRPGGQCVAERVPPARCSRLQEPGVVMMSHAGSAASQAACMCCRCQHSTISRIDVVTRPAQAVLGHAQQHTLLMMRPPGYAAAKHAAGASQCGARAQDEDVPGGLQGALQGLWGAACRRAPPPPPCPPFARQPGLGRQRRGESRSSRGKGSCRGRVGFAQRGARARSTDKSPGLPGEGR